MDVDSEKEHSWGGKKKATESKTSGRENVFWGKALLPLLSFQSYQKHKAYVSTHVFLKSRWVKHQVKREMNIKCM